MQTLTQPLLPTTTINDNFSAKSKRKIAIMRPRASLKQQTKTARGGKAVRSSAPSMKALTPKQRKGGKNCTRKQAKPTRRNGVQLFAFDPTPSPSKRKIKAVSRFDPTSEGNQSDCKTGHGFACPRCSEECSYDSNRCCHCHLECCYQAGLGVVVLRDRHSPAKKRTKVEKKSKISKAATAVDSPSPKSVLGTAERQQREVMFSAESSGSGSTSQRPTASSTEQTVSPSTTPPKGKGSEMEMERKALLSPLLASLLPWSASTAPVVVVSPDKGVGANSDRQHKKGKGGLSVKDVFFQCKLVPAFLDAAWCR